MGCSRIPRLTIWHLKMKNYNSSFLILNSELKIPNRPPRFDIENPFFYIRRTDFYRNPPGANVGFRAIDQRDSL